MLPDYYKHELYHYGIKGMKWGVRRYQNDDGSLTDKGIKRYAKKGYTEDSYNSNKTKLGKAYDKVTGAHKYGGDIMYNLSTKAENKARAEKYVKDNNLARKPSKKSDSVKNNVEKSKQEKTFEALKKGANALLDKADRDNFFNSDSIFSEESMKRQSRIDRTRDAINNLDYQTLTSPGAGKKLVDTGKQFLRDSLDDADDRSFFNDDWDTRMNKRERNDFFRDLLDD